MSALHKKRLLRRHPDMLDHIATHPDGRNWVGASSNSLALIHLYPARGAIRDLASRWASAPGLIHRPYRPGADAARLAKNISFETVRSIEGGNDL